MLPFPDTFKNIATQNRTRFQGKVVLITGGTSGIGFHSAAAFYQECAAAIIVVGRNAAAGDLSVKVLNNLSRTHCVNDGNLHPGITEYKKADIRQRAQLRGLMDHISAKHGRLDVAVFAAAIPGTMTVFDEVPDAEFLDQRAGSSADPILNNLYGTMQSTQEVLRFWVRTNTTGNIVTISSQDGLNAGGEWYGTSKHGIIGFTSSVAMTYGKNNTAATRPQITARINSVAPGMTDTPFTWNQAALYDPTNKGLVTQIGQCVVKNNNPDGQDFAINGQCTSGGTGYSCPCPDVTRADAHRIFGAIKDKSNGMATLTLPGVVLPPSAIADRVLFMASDAAEQLDINGQTYFVSNFPASNAEGDKVCATNYLTAGCHATAGVAAYERAVRSSEMCANC
jgi:NAD(P)-dependent dehydrogenase (short-subunit alcohol dehydrogenase family)